MQATPITFLMVSPLAIVRDVGEFCRLEIFLTLEDISLKSYTKAYKGGCQPGGGTPYIRMIGMTAVFYRG